MNGGDQRPEDEVIDNALHDYRYVYFGCWMEYNEFKTGIVL